MLDSSDQQRLYRLLSDTIPLLCKRTLGHSLELSVEAFIGITLSGEDASKEVVMVSFKETLLADGHVSSYVWSEVPSSSPDLPLSLVKSVAFNISESDSHDHRCSTVDAISGNVSELGRHNEYDLNCDDGKHWDECNGAMMNNNIPLTSRNATKGATETLASTEMIPFPVKMEENDDMTDEPDDFQTDADLESTSDIGDAYKNPYATVVRQYTLAPSPRGSGSTRPHYPATASHSLPKYIRGPRRLLHQPGSARSLSFQHLLPSSSCSKQRTKVNITSFPAMNTMMQSRHLEVNKM